MRRQCKRDEGKARAGDAACCFPGRVEIDPHGRCGALRACLASTLPGGIGAAQTSLRRLRKRNGYAGVTRDPCQELADRRFSS
jgi:hypothetical protein